MIDITIHITGSELSDAERAVLTALAGGNQPTLPVDWPPPVDHSAVEPEPAPKRHRRTKAEMEAARAAEEVQTSIDDTPVMGDSGDLPQPTDDPEPVVNQPVPEQQVEGATLDDAVKIAVKMVADGRNGDIKAFLGEHGIKRVSELKGDAINAFVAKFS